MTVRRRTYAPRLAPYVFAGLCLSVISPAVSQTLGSTPVDGIRPLKVKAVDCSQYPTAAMRDWCGQYNVARAACADKTTQREIGRCMHPLVAPAPPMDCDAATVTTERRPACLATKALYDNCIGQKGDAHIACMRAQVPDEASTAISREVPLPTPASQKASEPRPLPPGAPRIELREPPPPRR